MARPPRDVPRPIQMKMKPLIVFSLASLLCGMCRSAAAQWEGDSLHLALPGEVLRVDVPEDAAQPPARLRNTWWSVSFDGGTLVLDPSTRSRQPDWNLAVRSTRVPGDKPPQAAAAPTEPEPAPQPRHAVDMPAGAILAFLPERAAQGAPHALKAGRYLSAIPRAAQPVTLHDRWRASITSGGQAWTVATESTRRKDGALLAGSMALVATDAKGRRHVLVPPAHGMAFERQQLLWIGALGPHASPDLLIKRTWITGETDYVLRVGGALGLVRDDPDRTELAFSSGVDEYASTETHVARRADPLPERFGLAAFEIPEPTWNEAVQDAAASALPRVLFDRQLVVANEKIRFTVEHLPRLEAAPGEASSSNAGFWDGPVVVKAHFRGRSQALLQLNRLDGSNFRLQAGLVSGEPALQATFYPHYNNSFRHDWRWDAAQGRFTRLLRAQGQGC